MKFVYDKICELRSNTSEPTRTVDWVKEGSKEAEFLIQQNNARSNYNNIDAEFYVEPLYVEIIREAVKNGESYTYCCGLVVKYKYETINNCCIINTKEFRENEKGFVMYAYCAFSTCLKLRFTATYIDDKKETIKVIVGSNKNFKDKIIHMKKENGEPCIKHEQLRGVARLVTKEQLKNMKAYPFRANCISSLGSISLRLKTGKDTVPSPSVARTARSEESTKFKTDVDPYIDLFNMKRRHEDFIKLVSTPLNVELCYTPACEFYKKVKIHNVVYFDASGSTCGHPNSFENAKRKKKGLVQLPEAKTLFYTTLAEKDKSLLPLQMLITDDHTAHNIGFHLKNFKLECVNRKLWPIFRKVIMDFAPALSIALNFAYNDFSPNNTSLEYYEYCFKVLTSKTKQLKKDFIVIQGCCAHFAKIISNDLNRFAPGLNKKVKHIIQEATAFLTTTSTLSTQKEWWKHFCILFGSKKFTTFVQKSFHELCKIISYKENSETKDTRDANVPYPNPIQDEPSIYKNSPFYKYFKQSSDELTKILNLDAPSDNEYYVKGLIDRFLKKYMYNSCFWTNSMGALIESGGRFSFEKYLFSMSLSHGGTREASGFQVGCFH